MALLNAIGERVARQRGHLLNWAPVGLGFGVGFYFWLPSEPTIGILVWVGIFAGSTALAGSRFQEDLRPVAYLLALVAIGFLAAGVRAYGVAAPVLDFRFYGAVEGRIVGVDKSASDALRLTLDQVFLSGVAPGRTPERVRVSLHGRQVLGDPRPGMRIAVTAHLSPPSGPPEPGGFDFRRQAWFDRIGAVGYSRNPAVMLHEASQTSPAYALESLRTRIASGMRAHMSPDGGAFAIAVTTGDRRFLSPKVVQDLRDSNLAHLLAISGLHMGLLCGLVFAAIRALSSILPLAQIQRRARQIAAVSALLAGAVYLALSGGSVSTIRAYVMVSVMLGAVLLGRKALSMRAVAIAAMLLLVTMPESLFGPGFQMSFAATFCLIAVFGKQRHVLPGAGGAVVRTLLSVGLASLIAGFATAPFAAAHFNRFSHFGLVANILSVPLMGAVIMPCALVALVLAPFGLSYLPLFLMDVAIRWILAVAAHLAMMSGAVSHVVAPPSFVLPLIAVAGLWLALWQGPRGEKALCLLPAALAIFAWLGVARPAVLIADTGGLIGVLGAEGRALSKPKGDGFVATAWLANDGDGADQITAATREGLTYDGDSLELHLGTLSLAHLRGRTARASVDRYCQSHDIVVTPLEIVAHAGDCLLLDASHLLGTGAVAIVEDAAGYRLVSVAQTSGSRFWSDEKMRNVRGAAH